jgi:PAS domain S-box-containing protein
MRSSCSRNSTPSTKDSPNLIVRFDRALRHVYINPAIESVTGRAKEEFLGKTNRELGMPEHLVPLWEAAVQQVFATGQSRTIEYDFQGPREMHRFQNRLVPEFASDGKVENVLVVGHDVSELKRASEQVARSEERLMRAQRAAQVGTWDWDLSANQASWTDEAWRLFAHEPLDVPVHYELWLQSVHPDDRARAAAEVTEALRAGGLYRSEYRVLKRDGSTRFVESTGEVVLGADGAPTRMVGTVRDVTAQRAAEAKLREALRSRERLLSMVSHDLKTPLGALVMGIEALRNSIGDASARERNESTLARMARQTTRMDVMVDGLLDAASAQAGAKFSLNRSAMDLVSVARVLVEDYQRTAFRHKLELQSSCESLLGHWDSRRIERVINNLLSNAVKYSPAGGRIQLTLAREEDASGLWATLRISDQGIGVPESERTHVFQWFGRASNAERQNIVGTGIGLAGVREIVEQHGGSISLSSVEGAGSTFTVRLPIGL